MGVGVGVGSGVGVGVGVGVSVGVGSGVGVGVAATGVMSSGAWVGVFCGLNAQPAQSAAARQAGSKRRTKECFIYFQAEPFLKTMGTVYFTMRGTNCTMENGICIETGCGMVVKTGP